MMRKQKKAAYLCTVIVLLITAGCGYSDTDSDVSTVDTINSNDVIDTGAEENNSNNQNIEEDIDSQQDSDTEEENTTETQSATETQNTTETPKVREAQEAEISVYEQQQAQKQAVSYSDEELEEKLAAYRQAREEKKPIDLGNGVTMGGNVNPEEYGIFFNVSVRFDTGELMEAIETADSYVKNTLKISVETEEITYMCVDPRIYEIYSSEDKGVANGYESENIYVREYCENGTWQYLILVRDGKGSAWNVIHHGSSYLPESNEI